MRTSKWFLMPFLFFVLINANANAQNFLFKHPRQGGFKFVKNDRYDFSNWQHFTGSGIVAVGFYRILKKRRVKHAKLKAGLLASTVGLLKEWEDGYREGWGIHDSVFNQLGILSFLLFQNVTQFTFTVMPVIAGAEDFGFGLQFFRTSEMPYLRTSFGVFLEYTNHGRTWVGLDSHVRLYGNTTLRFGASMINLQDPNRFEFRPNIGLGFHLF